MLHKTLSGFDYQNSIYYYNVGEGPHRIGMIILNSDLSQQVRDRDGDAMLGFNKGDIVVAYLKRKGFVGVLKDHIAGRDD